jgi:iron(II)-dependent oxidoreductase
MSSPTAVPLLAARDAIDALVETRERTLALVAHLDDAALERVHTPLLSPLVWDLGHIAAFEDLWAVHRNASLPLLRPDLAQVYDAFETPRAGRGALPYLRRGEALDYLAAVRDRTFALIEQRGVGSGLIHELVIRHEQQHNETMLQTFQLAHLPAPSHGRAAPRRRAAGAGGLVSGAAAADALGGLELVTVPAGPCTIGSDLADGFAYDNERPRHAVELPAFRIGRAPVTNATYLRFVEGGGYERREWWSDEGWAWKEEYDIERPLGWTADGQEWRLGARAPLDGEKPVVHVSWFEADAFARAHDARLPTEAEWEKAATWDQSAGIARPRPWGGRETDALHANVDQLAYGTAPAGADPAGVSPAGCLGMLGNVWEWTSSPFGGYPGFVPDPYREYSEVFFGEEYRVLRGGSWATRPRIATATFRNWDYPQRRQIFAGLRIARDA